MKTLTKMTIMAVITMASLMAQADTLDCVATAGEQQINLKEEISAQPATLTLSGIISQPKNATTKFSFHVETYASGQISVQVDESKNGKIVSLMSSAGDFDTNRSTNIVLEGIMSGVYVHVSCFK